MIRAAEVLASAEAAWPLARGNPSAYAGALSRAWVWLALCVAFLLPFARRPARILQLDLAVLIVGLSASYAAWARGNLGLSIPLVYPVLAYLLARLLWIGFRDAPPRLGPLRLGPGALQLGLLFLLAFRITLNVVDGIVIDVGRASVIGADHLLAGEPLYGGAFPRLIPHGDTYGPVTYVAYLPFAALLGDDAAAHIAAIAFDLAVAGGLYLAGGPLPAYLWAACPLTALPLNASTNDALLGALVLAAWLAGARGRPAARGALTVIAGLAKLAPLALVPLFALRSRAAALGAAAAAAVVLIPVALGPGLAALWDRTVRFQLERDSPFSLWGAHPQLGWLQTAVAAGAVLLAVAVAFGPRSERAVAALGAAVLVALQLAAEHWFYYYVAWFLPLALLALTLPAAAPARSTRPSRPRYSGSAPR